MAEIALWLYVITLVGICGIGADGFDQAVPRFLRRLGKVLSDIGKGIGRGLAWFVNNYPTGGL